MHAHIRMLVFNACLKYMTYTVLFKANDSLKTAQLQNKSRMPKVSHLHSFTTHTNEQVTEQPTHAKWWKLLIIQISPGSVPADCRQQQQHNSLSVQANRAQHRE